MADIMTVWSWSLGDFDRLETWEDLVWWHNKAIDMHNKTKGNQPP